MMAGWRARADAFLGRGAAAVTIPAMDGALRANTRLDEGTVLRAAPEPDNLVVVDGQVLYSSGNTVFCLAQGGRRESAGDRVVARYDAAVTCLAANGAGLLAAGLEDGRVMLGEAALQSGGNCPTALAFDGDSLVVAHGSAAQPPSRWRHDLMQRGASGSVWRVRSDGAPACLAQNLGWPAGVLVEAGGIVVSESWRHRVGRLDARGRVGPLLDDLPGYPSRLCRGAGGIWLAVFAPRNQLVEFVLREPGYRRRMMADIPEDYWVAPALVSGRSFLEPLQGGGVKHMATLNPWAPSRSYGLVVRLTKAFEPIDSWHSRADGRFHGVTSVAEHDGAVLVASRGGEAILALDPAAHAA